MGKSAPADDETTRETGLILLGTVAGEDGAGGRREDGRNGGLPGIAGPELLARWIEVQGEAIEEAQRIQDLSWQQARAWHPGLQRVIDVRRRRNIRLVFPRIGEGMFLVPPLWAVTTGDILVGYAVVEEL